MILSYSIVNYDPIGVDPDDVPHHIDTAFCEPSWPADRQSLSILSHTIVVGPRWSVACSFTDKPDRKPNRIDFVALN